MIAYNECGFCCMAQIFSFYIAMRAGEKTGYIISALGVIHRQPVTLLQLAAFLSPLIIAFGATLSRVILGAY